MTTKKELEKTIERLRIKNQEYYDQNLRNAREIKELTSDKNTLDYDKKRFLRECNNRADFIKQLLSIVLGEAKPTSKYEVIRDMFLEEIKFFKRDEHPTIQNYGRNFLSNPISDNST